MFECELPPYTFRIKNKGDKRYIFDAYRAKYVRATPEELVRQQICRYLCTEKQYPQTLVFNEAVISVNGMTRRCDTVVYSSNHTPLMLLEYKAPNVPITQAVFEQAMQYNNVLRVPYVVVSNGKKHFCCKLDTATNRYVFLTEIPLYTLL